MMSESKEKMPPLGHEISHECTACGSCVDVCPVDAISEGDPIFVIDQDVCTNCGTCVDECPVEAIHAN